MVYIDEAADYFDRNIGIILSQARKYNVGMVLAHQYLGQLDPRLQDAFASNTSIKFAGGVSRKDARALAGELGCEPSFIEAQPKLSFACAIKGVQNQAIPLQFPYGRMEALPSMSVNQRAQLQERMRALHAVHYTTLEGQDGADEPHAEAATGAASQIDDLADDLTDDLAEDPTKPSSSW